MRIEILSTLIGIALLTAAPTVAPVQDGDEDEFEEFEEFDDSAWTDFQAPNKEQQKRNLELDKLLQGAWQLVEFEAEDFEEYGRHDRAVALFGPGFFSIEIHIAFEERQGFPGSTFFQSGTFRYRFDDQGQLLAKLSIGAAYDRGRRNMRYERPGSVRTFGIEVSTDRLELTREPGGFRYEFLRMRNGDRDLLDVFGRPVIDNGLELDDFEPPNFEDPLEGDDPEDDEETGGDDGFRHAARPLHDEARVDAEPR